MTIMKMNKKYLVENSCRLAMVEESSISKFRNNVLIDFSTPCPNFIIKIKLEDVTIKIGAKNNDQKEN